jgi:serine/threonine protein phosphatase PrpC
MKIFSHSLQGKRESNEDQHVHLINLNRSNKNLNPINFMAVFDGHGGKLVSKYLKKNLPYFFIHKFKKNIYKKQNKAIDYFNKVYNLIQNDLKEKHPRAIEYCGSTACVLIHFIDHDKKQKLWVLNVGDSRAIKCNKFNIAEPLTQDHKPNSPEERNRIEKLGGKIQFDGADWRIKDLSLSRAFGDLDCTPFVTHLPQIYNYTIDNDKFIIIACDGLWDVLSNQDAVDFINNLLMTNYKGNYAKLLAEHALRMGSMDNISVIVYFI